MKNILFALSILYSASVFAQVEFPIESSSFVAGDTVRANFRANAFDNIAAFQFSIKADTSVLYFAGIETSGALPIGINAFSWWGEQGFLLDAGEVRCAWYDTQGHDLQNGTVIFTICFVAKKAGALDESVEVWNGLYPCAYTPQLQFRVLDIYFTSEQNSIAANEPNTPVPFMVYPNPFINSTSLKFDGYNYGEIDIAVFDENGGQVLVKTITATGAATNLDMDGVEAGTYFVVAKMPNGSTFATTIISR